MKILLIIFITSFVGWFISSYRITYLANDKLKKASLLAGVEEVLNLLIPLIIIVSYSIFENRLLLILSLIVAFIGACLGTYTNINDFKRVWKWVEKLTNKII